MRIHKLNSNIWLRFLGIILGITILIWLTLEDKSETKAIFFAIGINFWIAIYLAKHKIKQSHFKIVNFVMLGVVFGAAVTPVTLFLMAFKTGLHSHNIPEYTNVQIISVIRRTPIWMIGSFFISLGLGILNYNIRNQKDPLHATEC